MRRLWSCPITTTRRAWTIRSICERPRNFWHLYPRNHDHADHPTAGLHPRASRGLARRDGINADQFLATAAAEKVSALRTVDFLKAEAAQGRVEDWDFVLSRVPARPPLPGDELPE